MSGKGRLADILLSAWYSVGGEDDSHVVSGVWNSSDQVLTQSDYRRISRRNPSNIGFRNTAFYTNMQHPTTATQRQLVHSDNCPTNIGSSGGNCFPTVKLYRPKHGDVISQGLLNPHACHQAHPTSFVPRKKCPEVDAFKSTVNDMHDRENTEPPVAGLPSIPEVDAWRGMIEKVISIGKGTEKHFKEIEDAMTSDEFGKM